MGGGVKVPGVDGGERGGVNLKLCLVCPPEQQFQFKVKWGQLDQHREPGGQDLPLHRPDIDWPLLVFASRNAEEGVEEVN